MVSEVRIPQTDWPTRIININNTKEVVNSLERTRTRRRVMSRVLTSVVLASQSRDRLDLLKNIGISPRVIVSNFEENLSPLLPPTQFVQQTALGKLENVLKLLEQENKLVIACDTVIYHNNEVIGKPKDEEDAVRILSRLSGSLHSVYSGVALSVPSLDPLVFSETTQVTFRTLSPQFIEQYVRTGEPLGRAGAYAIQRKGALLIQKINGCHNNVVGLPLSTIIHKLEERGFTITL